MRPEADPDGFRDWFAGYWETQARKLGRTAKWAEPDADGSRGWWSEIAREELARVVRYQTGAAGAGARGLGGVIAREVLGGAAKAGKALRDLPLPAYVEVWHQSKRHRWFAVAGCWRTKKTAATENEETLNENREEVGVEIASTTAQQWCAASRELREWIIGLCANRHVSRAAFLASWRSLFGGGRGPAP